MKRRHHSKSGSSSGKSSHTSSTTLSARDFLRPSLPTSWAQYFDAVRAGNRWGVANKCNYCGARPPSEDTQGFKMSGYRKWRWLAVHISTHNKAKLGK